MTIHAENAKRYHERITDLNRIATRADPNFTPGGLAAWQRSEFERWQSGTAQVTIDVPRVPDRSTVLDGLKPRTADDVALAAREREKIAALRAGGRPIEAIIATADRSRLAAILDDVEVDADVLASGQGDAIIAERTAAIFDRLAEIEPRRPSPGRLRGCGGARAGVGGGLRRRRAVRPRGRGLEDGAVPGGLVGVRSRRRCRA